MKPGDKVWFVWERWCTVGDIVEGEVRYIDEHNKLATVKIPKANPRLIPFDLLFTTREALCEHYKKIFE